MPFYVPCFISSKKVTFTKTKKIFNIDDIDVNKILVSKKEQYGKYNSSKYFIGYNDNDVIRPLYLFISQLTDYINKFDKNKITMSIMIKDIQLLKNYSKIWKKIEKLMKIGFNTKTNYGDDDKYIKIRIMCLVSLVLDIRLNTLTFKSFIASGTHIFAYGSLILLQLPLHLLVFMYLWSYFTLLIFH